MLPPCSKNLHPRLQHSLQRLLGTSLFLFTLLVTSPFESIVSAQEYASQQSPDSQSANQGEASQSESAATGQHFGHHHVAPAGQHDPAQRAELREEFSDWFQDNEWLQHYNVDFQRIKMWRRITTIADADAVCNDGTPGVFYVRPGQGQGSKR